MEFRQILKDLRKLKGLSQVELAEGLHVSKSLIGAYETGDRKPSYEALENIADYFNVDIDYLMGRETGSTYYLDPEAAQIAQELLERPELKTLFRTSRNVSAEDLKIVQSMVDTLAKRNDE